MMPSKTESAKIFSMNFESFSSNGWQKLSEMSKIIIQSKQMSASIDKNQDKRFQQSCLCMFCSVQLKPNIVCFLNQ